MSHCIRHISSQPISFNFSKFNQVQMKPMYIFLPLISYHFKINQYWGQSVLKKRKKYICRSMQIYLKHRLSQSVQFSRSVMSNSLQRHGLQHARLPCPSPTPGVYPNSCSLSWWCHPTISSSVIPFSSHLQYFPASESFQMSQFFSSGGQSIGVSASALVLPMNIQDWFPSGWIGWLSLQSKVLSRVFSNTTVQKHQFFGTQLSL